MKRLNLKIIRILGVLSLRYKTARGYEALKRKAERAAKTAARKGYKTARGYEALKRYSSTATLSGSSYKTARGYEALKRLQHI